MLLALTLQASGIVRFEDLPPDVRRWLQIFLSVVVGLVLLADLLLVALLLLGRRRGRSLLAPRWSVADIFVGLQLWVWVTLAGTVLLLVPITLLTTRGAAPPPGDRLMSWALVPALVFQNIAIVGTVLLFVVGKYREPLSAVGLTRGGWPRGLLLGFVAALLSLPVTDLLDHLTRYAFAAAEPSTAVRVAEAMTRLVDIQQMLQPLLTPAWIVPLILAVGIIGPFGEEVFFRGFAYTALKKRFGIGWGMTLSALLFSFIHTSPMALVPIFAVGLLLAYLYERTGHLAAPFALHATNNTAAVLLLYLNPQFSFWERLFPTSG